MRNPLIALLTILLLAVAAPAQVRHAPAGNSLPDQATPDASSSAPDEPHAVMSTRQHDDLADHVDLAAFRKLAVFDAGRAKIFDTYAREQIEGIYGKERWKDDQTGKRYDPVFTYLDLLFNKSYYFDRPIIYVEVLDLRRNLLAALVPPAENEKWLKLGRLTPRMVEQPQAQAVLHDNADLRLLKGLNEVVRARYLFWTIDDKDLAVVSPQAGGEKWAAFVSLADPRLASAGPLGRLPVADPQLAGQVLAQLGKLRGAWTDADAPAVNAALAHLAIDIPRFNPQSYPPAWKRNAEYVYNLTDKFTIGYVAYFLGMVVLLIAFGAPHRWLIRTGVALALLGFAIHAAGFAVRGLLSGRWPIHNQYESFIAISLLAVFVGLILMLAKRQWLFGAAAAALGACALVFANTVAIPSNEVGQVAGILATSRILYVHVNMVLASYGLIGLGFFTSLFYLGVYYFPGKGSLRFAAAGLGGGLGEGLGSRVWGLGKTNHHSAAAFESSTPDPRPQTPDPLSSPDTRRQILQALDHAQMVVLQLAFWLLGVGILLGAYWADHAWGRFWAWDPKETWALITWIVYLIVIHVRQGVKNRGLATAWLSVAGFFVMLWTYWGVNLVLAGLHSYA